MGHTSDRRTGCRVSDEWTFRGMRMAVLENDLLRVVVALDRGAEIVEFRSVATGADPLLRLPGGIRDPRDRLPSIASAGGSFLDHYAGGWQEILPNGGPAATWRGAEYGQHGEVSLTPWEVEVVEDTADAVAIVCRVRALRTPLLLERRMTVRAGRSALFLDERLANEAGEDLDVMWGHHVAFGGRSSMPGRRSTPRRAASRWRATWTGSSPGAPPSGTWVTGRASRLRAGPAPSVDLSAVPGHEVAAGREMAYLSAFDGDAWYAITSRDQGFAMRWDGDLFRYLWLWQEFGAGSGFPWWKRVHTVALEPWTSYPTLGLPEAVRRGTQLVVPAGATIETSLVAAAFVPGGGAVTGVDRDGGVTCEEAG